jgi:hypothetical protein
MLSALKRRGSRSNVGEANSLRASAGSHAFLLRISGDEQQEFECELPAKQLSSPLGKGLPEPFLSKIQDDGRSAHARGLHAVPC